MSDTATAPRDVNAGFAAERAEQQRTVDAFNAEAAAFNALPQAERQAAADSARLAAFEARVAKGELVKIGDNRYQATTGYDRGETFLLQRSAVGDRQMLVMPEHGLDEMEGGKVRLYSAVPAWHGLGQIIPGGITSVQDVIRLGGLDIPAVSIPAAPYTHLGIQHEVPGQFHLANGITGEYWGTVGKVHKNVPVETSFAFMQNLVDDGEVTWESAGLMGNGRKVFISCKIPGGIVVDADGVGDYTDLFLVVQDARDGSGAYKAMVTPWRPLCQNTNRFALRDAVSSVRLRHSSGLPNRIEQARLTLGMSVKYAQEFASEETALVRARSSQAEFEALMADVFAEINDTPGGQAFGGRDKAGESTRSANSNDRREADLMARWQTEAGRVGENLFAVEQAFTGHLAWGKVRTGDTAADRWQARIEAELAGQDDGPKTRVHAKLLQVASAR